MLVMLTDRQVIAPHHVCASCLWASSQGEPRSGCCQRSLRPRTTYQQPAAYQCPMGFRLVEVDD